MKLTQTFLAFAIMTTIAQPAFAYLDPGAGSFMLQMLIAGLMSALFAIKMYWYRLKAFVAKLLGKTIDDPDSEETGNDEEQDQDKSQPSSDKKKSPHN